MLDLGAIEKFTGQPLTAALAGTARVVVTYVNGEFGVLAGTCNHAGGPLANGKLDGEYVTCPWHNWIGIERVKQASPLYSRRWP